MIGRAFCCCRESDECGKIILEDWPLKGGCNMGLFEMFKKKGEETNAPKSSGKFEVKFSPATTAQDGFHIFILTALMAWIYGI